MPPPLRAAAAYGLSYRPMTDCDLEFVEALYASTRTEEVAQTGWPPEQQCAFLAQQHRAQHHHYSLYFPALEWLIVERGEARVGRLYLDETQDRSHIVDISLIPGARGRGMGGAILSDILADARSRNKGVSIHVEITNPARRLYERLGFVAIEDKGIYVLMEWRPAPPDDQKNIAS